LEVFQHRPLGEAENRLVIPSVNMTNGQTKVFKTPHLPDHFIDRYFPVADAILATTAAPTYFPHAVIQKGSRYVDGGLWANNPGMVAVAESIRISKECRRPRIDPSFTLLDTHMLSIGTGSSPFFADPPEEGAGVAWWASRLIDLISIAQAQGAHFQAKAILADRYERIDFAIPDGSWRLDSVDLVEQMIHNGRQKATEELVKLRPRFFDSPVPGYHPFPDAARTPLASP
jgi:patatin-like phospholipase/acyl hydrolase